LKVLGMDSLALGFIGGEVGKRIQSGLRELEIETDFTFIQGETRTNTVILEEHTGRYIKVNEPGPDIQQQEVEALLDKVMSHLPCSNEEKTPGYTKQTWVLSGSLPPGVPPDIYASLIHRIQSSCSSSFIARAILDSSGEPFRLGLLARPYLVKPNRYEAESVTGFRLKNRSDLRKAGAVFLDMGAQIIAISLGAQGLFLCWEGESLLMSSPKIKRGNPTGAGDALLAGIIYALEKGETLKEAARWAVACGAAAAEGSGVNVPSFEHVKKLLQRTG
jgi:1-phosphofructokinase family hexose kinase